MSSWESQKEALTAVEYFAGIGLIRMGLESAGWSVVFANDNSAKKLAMYRDFFPSEREHYSTEDVLELDSTQVPSSLLATCSFPCIDLSLAGNLSGLEGEHSSAFWGFIRILREQGEASPPITLVENVPGWLTSNLGQDFRATVRALNELGYACDVLVLDARRFTPQSRPRVFLIGLKRPRSRSQAIAFQSRSESLTTKRLKQVVLENDDLSWSFLDVPEPPPLRTSGLGQIAENPSDVKKLWWSQAEVNRHRSMMADSHRERVERLIESNDISRRTFYRRRRNGYQRVEVRHGDTAGCLRTAVGGSSKQFLLEAGRGDLKMRGMTPREYARLQGVPDRLPIRVNGRQALTGFGDAVCVPAITWIAENIINPIAKDELALG